MEPAGRVAEDDVDVVRGGVLDAVVDDGRRIAALIVGDQFPVEPVGVLLDLFVRARPVGVAVGHHRRVAAVGEPLRELRDARRLADAVDAGEDDGDGLVGGRDPLLEVELADGDDVD